MNDGQKDPHSEAIIGTAQVLSSLGWPVMPVKAGSKIPLTRHGVKDATTDERTILHWFDRWPDANLAIATGTPGPAVLDIDDPVKGQKILERFSGIGCPEVATARGRHLYFRGTDQGTVGLEYGELRGRGSYVLCPPSTHVSGKQYVWLVEPSRRPLIEPPEFVIEHRSTAGRGEYQAVERVPHGQRHPYMKDFAVRLLRGGIVDADAIEWHLRAEFERVCDPEPPAAKDYFANWARWAVTSDIAQRKGVLADFASRWCG